MHPPPAPPTGAIRGWEGKRVELDMQGEGGSNRQLTQLKAKGVQGEQAALGRPDLGDRRGRWQAGQTQILPAPLCLVPYARDQPTFAATPKSASLTRPSLVVKMLAPCKQKKDAVGKTACRFRGLTYITVCRPNHGWAAQHSPAQQPAQQHPPSSHATSSTVAAAQRQQQQPAPHLDVSVHHALVVQVSQALWQWKWVEAEQSAECKVATRPSHIDALNAQVLWAAALTLVRSECVSTHLQHLLDVDGDQGLREGSKLAGLDHRAARKGGEEGQRE